MQPVWGMFAVALLCSACGPVPLPMAEQQCIEPAQLAQRPRGSFGIVADNRGNVGASLTVGISSDYVQGRDPDQVYATCVQNKSGLRPSLPFSALPESRM